MENISRMGVFFEEKNVFILFEGIFNKIGGAENLPEVAGRLVLNPLDPFTWYTMLKYLV